MMTRAAAAAAFLLAIASQGAAQNPTGETATPVRPRFATLAPVFFPFNSSAIADSARVALLAAVEILEANPAAEIVVVGHTDERGSDQYNQRLATRRAAAVAAFLAANGVPASRVQTASAGEREPADPAHSEAAWARNRRVEFRVKGNVPLRLPPR